MIVPVARRVLLMAAVLAVTTFLSFVFFWTHDRPVKAQPVLPAYWHWLGGLFTGKSYRGLFGSPLLGPLAGAVGHTCALLAVTFAITIPATIALAALAALQRGRALDLLLRATTYVAWGIPAFLLAFLLALTATTLGKQGGLGPFAIAGWPGKCPPGLGLNGGVLAGCPPAGHGLTYAWNVLRYVTVPALALAVGFVGLHARYLRAGLLQTLDAPYITTARAKGLSEWGILLKHAMRVSVSAFVGRLFADFGAIFGAAVAVEWVFKLNGLGVLFVRQFPLDSYAPLDVYSIQLVLLVTGGFVLLSSLLADTALALLDPRLRRDA